MIWKLYYLLVIASIFFYVRGDEVEIQYTTKYDDLDVDAIIASERLLRNYVNCLLEMGPCTPEGVELRKNMPEAIQSDCNKCSEKQKQVSDKMISYLIDNKPEYWEPLKVKYDPSGEYTENYLKSKKTE